ncbi:exodeoxyribonuclease VII small subunit [Tessaracoccus palaemonis]|uniref:Exodeoxyribonuclease 7 small subunit n=1 Tax=Tessaracoccus palaemonis TaxID=2829499 RepID=A0ABX8SN69_9ACTN|nr:exodeoxyribonuclease VII small subunit [Tessaracoccus palaemonis]QXT63508.1 exodeoxyribonuclease VII small subunit [Tessaracoccus palaemonis]
MPEEELTYEQARDELMQVVAKLESGGASLADSMALWQRGEKLADICQGFLDGAREQVAKRQAEDAEDSD